MSQPDLKEVIDDTLAISDNEVVKDIAHSVEDTVENKTPTIDVNHQMEDGVELGLSITEKTVQVEIKIPL